MATFAQQWSAYVNGDDGPRPPAFDLDLPAALGPTLDAGYEQGWLIADGCDSDGGPVQLQRIDTVDDDDVPQLDDDTDAWNLVLSAHAAGESLAGQVVDLILLTNPLEYMAMFAWQGQHQLPASFDPNENLLESIRASIRAERVSYGELALLQGMVEHIDPGDVELLEWAGVPEFPDHEEAADG